MAKTIEDLRAENATLRRTNSALHSKLAKADDRIVSLLSHIVKIEELVQFMIQDEKTREAEMKEIVSTYIRNKGSENKIAQHARKALKIKPIELNFHKADVR
jgi:hypothetical protein